jgi:hypothetical protein
MDLMKRTPSFTNKKKGIEGLLEISQMMVDLRKPIKRNNGQRVLHEDYQSSVAKNLLSVQKAQWTFQNQMY